MNLRTQTASFNLNEVIDGEFVEPHFQPIVSIGKKSILGYEGLTRGIHPLLQHRIYPCDLFSEAKIQGLTYSLDVLCRQKVLEQFKVILGNNPDAFLSLNFEVSVIDQKGSDSGKLIQQVLSLGLKPESIAMEVIESQVEDLAELQNFIQTYQGYGFLIALDDVGAGHSNLNRIPLLKPDILKIDRFLVENISKDFYKQEVFKSLVGLARQIGALIVAEGIETEEDALTVMEMGVDMLQGYFITPPQRFGELDAQVSEAPIQRLSQRFKEMVLEKLNVKRFNLRKYELMTREIQTEVSKIPECDFDRKLLELIHYFPLVECVYVLDEHGIQCTETIFGEAGGISRNRTMFKPRKTGSDHSLRDYYYMVVEGGGRKTTYVSEAYLSQPTGSLCVTFARLFKDINGITRILCADINTQYLKQVPTF